MGILKTPFIVLVTELKTMDDPEGPAPWRWTQLSETMKFPIGSYPLSGMTKLPMTAPDLKDIADHEEDYNKLQIFFRAIDDIKFEDDKIRARIKDAVSNQFQPGLKLYKAYWGRIASRAKLNLFIDAQLLEREAMPWHLSRAEGFPWPPKDSKGFGEVSVADVIRHTKGIFIAKELFGSDCGDHPDHIPFQARNILTPIIQMAWDRAIRREPRLRKKIEAASAESGKAWEKVHSMPVTASNAEKLKMLRDLFKFVKAHCDALKALGEDGVLEAQKHEDDVKQMIDGVKGNNLARLAGKAKGLEKLLESMKAPEAIQELERIYEQEFVVEEPIEAVIEDVQDSQEWLDKDGDHGVAEFKTLSVQNIRGLLGLGDHFPFFNRVIHDLRKWPEEILNFEELNVLEDGKKLAEVKLRPLEPKWHQYVGLAACVKRFFNGENVLLADGVGVGKTMQCFMIMAYLRHLNVTNVTKERLPPIAFMKIGEERRSVDVDPCWGWRRSERIYPTGHIFVAVPNALAPQWYSEAKRMLDSRYWNIVIYPANDAQRKQFWTDVWAHRVSEGVTTILIATHSVIRSEASRCISQENTRRYLPDQGPNVTAPNGTLFAQSWSLVFWDEAQWLRTEGHLLRAAHAMRLRSGSTVFCSATPLHNGERDLVSLGLALGMKEREELLLLETELRQELNRVVRETVATGGMTKTEIEQTLATGKGLVPKPGTREYEKQSTRVDIVGKMRKLFTSVVIRRRNSSLDQEGHVINGLPPLKKYVFMLNMSDEEATRFEVIRRETAAKLERTTFSNALPTKTFFSEYRIAVGHAGFFQSATPDDTRLYTTREEWIQKRSTKWGMITKLVLSLLTAKSDEELPAQIDGKMTFYKGGDPEEVLKSQLDDWAVTFEKELPENKGSGRPFSKWPFSDMGTTKIIIYVEFVKTLTHLVRGLELSGIEVIAATGRKIGCNGRKWGREEALTAFMNPSSNYRVLILSSVGNAGLNLHMARFMIFADAVWSGQSEEQIIGRMYRQPNEQDCVVYVPLVHGTSDEILTAMGSQKRKLLDVFYDGDVESDDEGIVPDPVTEDGDAEYIDTSTTTKEPKRGNKGKGKAKAKADQTGGENVEGGKTTRKRRAVKSKETIEESEVETTGAGVQKPGDTTSSVAGPSSSGGQQQKPATKKPVQKPRGKAKGKSKAGAEVMEVDKPQVQDDSTPSVTTEHLAKPGDSSSANVGPTPTPATVETETEGIAEVPSSLNLNKVEAEVEVAVEDEDEDAHGPDRKVGVRPKQHEGGMEGQITVVAEVNFEDPMVVDDDAGQTKPSRSSVSHPMKMLPDASIGATPKLDRLVYSAVAKPDSTLGPARVGLTPTITISDAIHTLSLDPSPTIFNTPIEQLPSPSVKSRLDFSHMSRAQGELVSDRIIEISTSSPEIADAIVDHSSSDDSAGDAKKRLKRQRQQLTDSPGSTKSPPPKRPSRGIHRRIVSAESSDNDELPPLPPTLIPSVPAGSSNSSSQGQPSSNTASKSGQQTSASSTIGSSRASGSSSSATHSSTGTSSKPDKGMLAALRQGAITRQKTVFPS